MNDEALLFLTVERNRLISILRAANVQADWGDGDTVLVARFLGLDPAKVFFDRSGFERGLLRALTSTAGIAALEDCVRAGAPTQDGSMLHEIHRRLLECGESPIGHLVSDRIEETQRDRQGATPAQAHVAAAKYELELDAADDAKLRARVLAAVVREMGLAAPPEGSKSRDDLADRLLHAVTAHSLARVELFSDRLRSMLQEAYFQSESDAGAYGAEWRREIALNGIRGLADETDAALLERVLINVDHQYLVSSAGTWFGDHEREFLTVMGRDSQVEIMRAAIDDTPYYPLQTAIELAARYQALGMNNPYGELLAELEVLPGESGPTA